jgi:hypothetical protein
MVLSDPARDPMNRAFGTWALLACFFLAGSALTFIRFDDSWRTCVFLAGIVLPFLLWMRRNGGRSSVGEFWGREFLPSIHWGPWVVLFLCAFAVRFWRIEDLFAWPIGDEGLCGWAGIELGQRWSWRYFYTAGQDPPTIFWACGLFYKFSSDPFFNLWGPPAVLSLLSVGMGYLAARQFFSSSFSFLCTALLAFSYWSLYLGRFAFPASFLPLWWLFTLYCLGKYLKVLGPSKGKWAWVLGVVNGLNTFTFTSWPFFAFVTGVTVLWEWWDRKHRAFRDLALFGSGCLLGLLPFLAAVLQEGYGHHVVNVGVWNHPEGWSHLFRQAVSYLMVLSCGTYEGDNYCAPLRGGFLNPILALFFYLGLASVLRERVSRLARWLVLAGSFFLLPGIFSLNMDGNRVLQVLPILVVVTAVGFRDFLEGIPPGKRWVRIGVVLLASLALDLFRLWGPYLDIEGNPRRFVETGRSLARYRAYQVLQETARKEGPGIVLGEWDILADRTMQMATFPFNAAKNPGLDPAKANWLAILVDIHYRPFLEERFAKGSWRVLDGDFNGAGTLILGVIPMDPASLGALSRWALADKAFAEVNWAVDHLHQKDCLERMERGIRENYPMIQGDRFLEACYWEKVGKFYYYYGDHFPEHLRAAQLAVERGVPASHLYFELAGLWKLAGETAKVQEALAQGRGSERRFPWR